MEIINVIQNNVIQNNHVILLVELLVLLFLFLSLRVLLLIENDRWFLHPLVAVLAVVPMYEHKLLLYMLVWASSLLIIKDKCLKISLVATSSNSTTSLSIIGWGCDFVLSAHAAWRMTCTWRAHIYNNVLWWWYYYVN